MILGKKQEAILAQSLPEKGKNPFIVGRASVKTRWFLLPVGLFLFVMAAFGIAPQSINQSITQKTIIENINLPLPNTLNQDKTYWREEFIQSGDTVSDLLIRLGVEDEQAAQFLLSNKAVRSLYQLRPGKTVQVKTTEEGQLLSLRYLSNTNNMLAIEREGEKFKVTEQSLNLETRVLMKTATIKTSLFAATDSVNLPDNIAIQVADIFAGEIDFHRDLRQNDRFTVIYEMFYHHGTPIKAGRVLAAEFINQKKSHRAVFFQGKTGNGYYTPSGKNLRKAFLRSPLEFSRISSGFTLNRFHPILKKWRAHKGVDYAAPIGTRIKATADGTVEFIGWKGGYGKIVILRHQNRFSTAYGHMQKFAIGLRYGSKVKQGDIIGYVGKTGWATGPHLHYEFRVNNEPRNPLSITLPPALPIADHQLIEFKTTTQPLISNLNLLTHTNLAALE